MIAVTRGEAPLIVSVPHAGTDLADVADFVSPERARRDADLYVDRLYAFAAELGATLIATPVSRSVIDANRDPEGNSLYPGQFTTGLCPTQSFDGEPLYRPGHEPDAQEIARRRAAFFDPYHAAIAAEIARLRARHPRIVLYDAHSIRSRAPLLFEGELPVFNLGTNGGASCDPALEAALAALCAATGEPWVANGRFKGGWTTRHYGAPSAGVHAVQMELAMRAYLVETPGAWPPPWDEARAEACRAQLRPILSACIEFATRP